jgi:hypothetical protein
VRPILTFWLLALLSRASTDLLAQAAPADSCGDSKASAMAFLQGEWQGRSYSITGRDTVLDGLMTVKSRPLLGRCALEEEWSARKDGRTLFTAKVIRAYDGPTRRWSVYYVDDQLNSQIYEGRMDGSQWRFFRTRRDQGKRVQVRLTWRPAGHGYEQLIERSRDGGATWVLGGFVTFTAANAHGP